MKKLLAILATTALVSSPAMAYPRDHERPRHERVHPRAQVWVFGDILANRHRNRYINQCHWSEDVLTIRGLRTSKGRLVTEWRDYPVRSSQCVRHVKPGDIVYQDLNRNGRQDYREPYGFVRFAGFRPYTDRQHNLIVDFR